MVLPTGSSMKTLLYSAESDKLGDCLCSDKNFSCRMDIGKQGELFVLTSLLSFGDFSSHLQETAQVYYQDMWTRPRLEGQHSPGPLS